MIAIASPELLQPDNFTPPQRTPWGGRRIVEQYKRGLELSDASRAYAVVGESWEVACDAEYPSVVRRTNRPLAALIAAQQKAWLGNDVSQLPLVVKWIDTADRLSVQVHPPKDFVGLRAGESGKWEAWWILDAEPDAGVYLGFKGGVTRAEVQRCAAAGGAIDALLNFVRVDAGDVFVIEPGTPHALGAGLTLLEPQVVAPGKSGVTYRFWDWNRRYDGTGRPAANGAPRALHLAESMAVTRWDAACDDNFAATCRKRARPLPAGAALAREVLVETGDLIVERWSGSGQLSSSGGAFRTLTCVAGNLKFESEAGSVTLRTGESAVVPAAIEAASINASAVDLLSVILRP
jgi:mannose-6-phosphate isomerase